MNNKYANVLAETDYVLNHSEIKSRIPLEILEKIDKIKNKDYKVKYDGTKTLYEQNFSKETFKLLSSMYLTYCVSENEKKNLIETNKVNNEKRQEALKQKYNPDNLFINRKVESVNNNRNNEIVDIKENFFVKIKKFLKRIFRKG